MHKNSNNANIGIIGFISWKQKKNQLQNATLVSIEPLDLWFQVQHAPLYTNLAFACKTETLGSLYSHALLIPLNHQSPNIKCCMNRSLKISQVALAKREERGACWTWDQRSSGSILIGVTFCNWIFLFSRSKTSDANIDNIESFV